MGRGTTRAEDAQGTPTLSHISPSILVYEEKSVSLSIDPPYGPTVLPTVLPMDYCYSRNPFDARCAASSASVALTDYSQVDMWGYRLLIRQLRRGKGPSEIGETDFISEHTRICPHKKA